MYRSYRTPIYRAMAAATTARPPMTAAFPATRAPAPEVVVAAAALDVAATEEEAADV